MEETSVFEKFELQLDESAKDFLKETAKWAYFLSIIGYVGIGLLVLIAIFAGTFFSLMSNSVPGMAAAGGSFGFMFSIIYLIMALLYFFPVYYLNKFASNAKKAFRDNDSEALTNSFQYLKSHYKFIGILTVVLLALYGVILIFAVIAGLIAG